MAEIRVLVEGPNEFRVEVHENGTVSVHQVTTTPEQLVAYGEISPVELVEESFRFLLEREPKESILSRFELSVIGRYFPEYPDEIRRRLTAD